MVVQRSVNEGGRVGGVHTTQSPPVRDERGCGGVGRAWRRGLMDVVR